MRCPECNVHRANGHLLGCSTGAAGARPVEIHRQTDRTGPSSARRREGAQRRAPTGPAAPAHRTDHSSTDVAGASALERAQVDSVRVGSRRVAPEDVPGRDEL